MSRKVIDIVGQKFGSLAVVSFSGMRGKQSRWLCHCDCGSEVTVDKSNLMKAHRCLNCMNRVSWEPIFEDSICKIPLPHNKSALIDSEDYEKVKNYKWSVNRAGYVISNESHRIEDHRYIYLARIIMEAPDDLLIDHIWHNKLDNRKSELRFATPSQNNMNMVLRKDNTTGFKGIDKKKNRYRARIQVDNKEICLGWFDKIEDAVAARKRAEITYHKEYRFKGGQDGIARNSVFA